MAYYIDLTTRTLDRFKEEFMTADVIPSWAVIKKDLAANLEIIKQQNIHNLDELLTVLKNKAKLKEMAGNTGIPEDYLGVLKRVVSGYQPKPNRIKDFPGISGESVHKLEALKIKTTQHLYEKILTPGKRKELAEQTGIGEDEINRLTRLTDLSRIRWVNHTFAYVLLEAGYDTARKVAEADYQHMYETIIRLNKERELYKGKIGAHDMKLCVEAAVPLDYDIEY